eukprot:m.27083 g.27083  ORF g.27083 m.27083 type:complete len:706 (+) comp7859_c0_seq2:314-2431(+)
MEKNMMSEQSCNLTMEGYVEKEGYVKKSWKKRWFVLHVKQKLLCYYTDNTKRQRKGSIQLQDVIHVRGKPDAPLHKHRWDVKVKNGRTYHMSSATEEEKEMWVNGLEPAVEKEKAVLATSRLLPEPRAVQLWIQDRVDLRDVSHRKEQGIAAIPWLVDALKSAYLDRSIKEAARGLLEKRRFTTNLSFYTDYDNKQAFEIIRNELTEHLRDLGSELHDYYEYQKLGQVFSESHVEQLTKYHLLFQDKQKTCNQAIVMSGVSKQFPYDSPSLEHMYEEQFLHGILLTACCVDEMFQDKVGSIAAQFGMNKADKTFLPTAPKSFVRARNKMYSDYRYEEKPRTGLNVDVIRNLCVCEQDKTLGFYSALVEAFDGVAKKKCLYGLTKEEQANRFHLLSLMITVVYDTGMTYKQLLKQSGIKEKIDVYCKNPKVGFPKDRWEEHTANVIKLFTTKACMNERVKILGEVQIVLPKYAAVRHKMHEPYKAFRAETPEQLYNDYLNSGNSGAGAELQAESDNIYDACFRGQYKYVKKKLAEGADVDESGKGLEANGSPTPLYVAAQRGYIDVVKVLLDAGATVNKGTTTEGITPLLIASYLGFVDVVKILLDAGAFVNQCRSNGGSPLCLASQRGWADVASLLIEEGANINHAMNDGFTSLMIASKKGYLDVVKVLLNAGAETHHKSKFGVTAMSAAKDPKIKELLIKGTRK